MVDLRRDERGVTAVVSKTLVIGIALLYIGGMSTLLFGSVVPEYQTQAGDELAERALATAAGSIEQSVLETDGIVDRTRTVELPGTIDNRPYQLDISGTQLTLEHPDRGIGAQTQLSLPSTITIVDGSWHSGDTLAIRVTGPAENRTIQIQQ